MTASLETLVIAAYVFADSLRIPRPGPQGKITDAELIALAVAQASMGMPSDRQFLGMVAYRLAGWFAHLPDQSQYNVACGGSFPTSAWSSSGWPS